MYAYTRERDRFVRTVIAFSLLVGLIVGSAVWKALS
jgi:hypothetical protein